MGLSDAAKTGMGKKLYPFNQRNYSFKSKMVYCPGLYCGVGHLADRKIVATVAVAAELTGMLFPYNHSFFIAASHNL